MYQFNRPCRPVDLLKINMAEGQPKVNKKITNVYV